MGTLLQSRNVTPALATPRRDPGPLFEHGVLGIPLVQYLAWAECAGLSSYLARSAATAVKDVVAHTALSERGADALLGVLCGLDLVRREPDGRYRLLETGREYLDPSSPFYMGLSLYGMLKSPPPKRMLKGARPRRFSEDVGSLWDKVQYRWNGYQWGRIERLRIQHSRNFPSAIVAARTGEFDRVRHLVDIGGGSGVFAIPLALDRSDLRITLVDLPRSLPNIKQFLRDYGVDSRVHLAGLNVHDTPWPFRDVDGVLFANFMHSCDDDECRALLRESRRILSPGGRLFVHEMLWNDSKEGPLLTSLWNFWMVSVSAGRQRTKAEFAALIAEAGFSDCRVVDTAGCFSLLTATRARL
jgi:ubiquinone/menaquinone biosynthesis C-methylase UbiE